MMTSNCSARLRTTTGRLSPPGAFRRVLLTGALTAFFVGAAQAEAEIVEVLFGTDIAPTEWLITGAGVVGAPARSTTIYPSFISFSSDGTASGSFIPGASAGAFDGAWYASFLVNLPRRAQNVAFEFFDLAADDRVVLRLNRVPIGDATISGESGAGVHKFAPGGQNVPYTFANSVAGFIDGNVNPDYFILGEKDPRGPSNIIQLSVNNAASIDTVAIPLRGGVDGTLVRVGGGITWTEDYQIRPYPNPQGSVVQVDDDPHGWYNAVQFTNYGVLVVDGFGKLTNRAGASLENVGQIQNNGNIVFIGSYSSMPYASFINSGALAVQGKWEEYGAFVNTGLVNIGSGAVFTFAGPGGGDKFLNQGDVTNRGDFIVTGKEAEFLSVGASDFVNHNNLMVKGGAYFDSKVMNYGTLQINTEGLILGDMENQPSGRVIVKDGGSMQGSLLNFGRVEVSLDGLLSTSTAVSTTIVNPGSISIYSGGNLIIAPNGTLSNKLSGQLNIGVGSRLWVMESSRFENLSTNVYIHGTATVDGDLINATGGLIYIVGSEAEGRLNLRGASLNDGEIKAWGGATVDIGKNSALGGDGKISLLGGSLLIVDGHLFGNSVDCNNSFVKVAGTISGDLKVSNCKTSPGNSPGTMTVLGALNMRDNSIVELEIGSPDDYDRLVTSGPVLFENGTMVEVSFVDGYLPDELDDFHWLTGSQITGAETLEYLVPPIWTASVTSSANGTHLSTAHLFAAPLDNYNIWADQVAFVPADTEYHVFGSLENSGALHNRQGATLVIEGSSTLTNRAGAWLVNRGLQQNNSTGTLHNEGTLYNHATGTLINEGDLINVAGGRLVNRGVIVHKGSGTFRNDGRVDNRGEIVSSGDIENHGVFEIAAGASVHGDASYGGRFLQVSGETRVDGLLAAESIVISGGLLGGNGQLQGRLSVESGATIDPGSPFAVGLLSLSDGSAALEGTLHIDLAGASLADLFDVNGSFASNAGTLQVSLLGDYRPQRGDIFDFLKASSGGFVANFANQVLPALEPGLAWEMLRLDDGSFSTLRLEVVAVPVPEPAPMTLLATGLGIVALWARRRAKA